MKANQPCLCGRNAVWKDCCGRFLEQQQNPKTAEQLMRSRYCAYALGGHGEYLLKTWFPATAEGLTVEDLSEKNTDWLQLEVLDKTQQGNKASVEFKAWYRSDEADAVMLDGITMKALHEKSAFTRVAGRWLYIGGEIR